MKAWLAVLACLATLPAHAQSKHFNTSPDPYVFTNFIFGAGSFPNGSIIPGWTNVSSKTQVDCTPPASGGIVVEIIGQSLGANWANDNYVVSNTGNVLDFNIYNSGCYQTAYPEAGVTGVLSASIFARLADNWINAATFQRVVLANAAVGGSGAADWATGALNGIPQIMFKRLQAAHLTLGAVVYEQGEADCIEGTSQSAYSASLATTIANIRQYFTGPIFINQETYDSGTTCPSTIAAAQIAAVNHSANVWAGANWDVFGSSDRYDNTHPNATGAAAMAAAEQTAMHAVPPF